MPFPLATHLFSLHDDDDGDEDEDEDVKPPLYMYIFKNSFCWLTSDFWGSKQNLCWLKFVGKNCEFVVSVYIQVKLCEFISIFYQW